MKYQNIKLNIVLDKEVIDIDITAELSINKNVYLEYFKQPAKAAFFAALWARVKNKEDKAKKIYEDYKDAIEVYKSKRAQILRTQFSDLAVTILKDFIKEKVNIDKRKISMQKKVNKLYDDYLYWKKYADMLEGIKFAFNQRKDMLIQIGTDSRYQDNQYKGVPTAGIEENISELDRFRNKNNRE